MTFNRPADVPADQSMRLYGVRLAMYLHKSQLAGCNYPFHVLSGDPRRAFKLSRRLCRTVIELCTGLKLGQAGNTFYRLGLELRQVAFEAHNGHTIAQAIDDVAARSPRHQS